MAITFFAAEVVKKDEILHEHTVIVSDSGEIEFLGPDAESPDHKGQKINLRGKFLTPGFIEQHIHGGYGLSLFDDDNDASRLRKFSLDIVQSGVTGFLAGIFSDDHNGYLRKLKAYSRAFTAGLPGAEGLGFFIESSYINPECRGSSNPEWYYAPTLEHVKDYVKTASGWLKIMVIAPEMDKDGETARYLKHEGVTVSLGVTACDYDMARDALATTHTNIDHLFNNFKVFHHRKPGAVGAVLSTERPITCELITDMFHVHPGVVKIVYRCLGKERIVIVSDGMMATGLGDGVFTMGDSREITVKDYCVTLPDGTISASASPLNRNVRLAIQEARIPFLDAIQMVTLNPAKAIGIADRVGSIEVGKDANLVVIDEEINVFMTMIKGQIHYFNMN